MNFNRKELCLIQQSLGLREMTLINSSIDLSDPRFGKLLMAVRHLRAKTQSEIRVMDMLHEDEIRESHDESE